MTALAPRELYIYWKTAHRAAAIAAARAMQAGLCDRWPQMQAELLWRDEPAAPLATLMEVYRNPGGVTPEHQADIERHAAQLLATHLTGTRHVEVFCAAR